MIYTMQQYNQQLVDARVALSSEFKKDLSQQSPRRCQLFMLQYCHIGGHLALLLSEWTSQMASVAQTQAKQELVDALKNQVIVMQTRYQLLTRDATVLAQDLGEELGEATLTSGIKQLRFIFRECLRRKDAETWLAILFELCRIRLVHGSVVVQMCRSYFGLQLLRKLRHVHYEHRENAKQLNEMDNLLHNLFLRGNLAMGEVIASVKTAITAYATFIHDCCNLVTA